LFFGFESLSIRDKDKGVLHGVFWGSFIFGLAAFLKSSSASFDFVFNLMLSFRIWTKTNLANKMTRICSLPSLHFPFLSCSPAKFFISQRILCKFIQIMKKNKSARKPNNISIPQIFKKKVGHNDKKKEKDRFLSTTRKFAI